MTTPSDISNHPLVQMLDYQNDAFPTGSSYFLKNLCSNFYQSLAFDHNAQSAVTCTAQADPDCKWLIQYENNDRSRVALKSARNGRYLAATTADNKASIGLSEQMVFWWVHQGSAPGTYWLATTQSKDCFLHTWDSRQGEGSLVASFTNRDPKDGSTYNNPYSVLEEGGGGLSWGLDPTPELVQWKEQQKQGPQGQQSQGNGERMKEREEAVAEKERQIQEREADMQRKIDDLQDKEQTFETKSQDFEKSYDELKKREEAVRAAEERVKKSKKGGKAEHLATQEEKDKLKGETKDLHDELEAAKAQIHRLKHELQQATNGQSQNRGSLVKGSNLHFSIRSPEVKHPSQKLPERKVPGRTLPAPQSPGQSLPSGYNADMMKRFEAGKKAMVSTKA